MHGPPQDPQAQATTADDEPRSTSAAEAASAGGPAAADPPDMIGPYRVLRRLGEGGMGEVYEGYDDRLDRPVALKCVLSQTGTLDQAHSRFRNEARAVARLNHPSIVQVYDWVETDGSDWIVMELVAGRSLRQLLADGPLEPQRAARIARDVASGLAAAHAAGIVHRDLKPENVMVASAGRAKILDFGIAKRLQQESEPLLTMMTREGVILGTVNAMSPEQAIGGKIDHRSDLFSLGTLLYQMTTSRLPFRGSRPVETLTRICTRKQKPAAKLNPQVPAALSDLIDHLLEKKPSDRPQSAGEVVAALDGFLAGATTESPELTLLGGLVPQVAGENGATLVRTLLACDLVAGGERGDARPTELSERLPQLAKDLLAEHDGWEIDRSDGLLVLLERPLAAVLFALDLQRQLARSEVRQGARLTARVGIHLGEVKVRKSSQADVTRGAKPFELEGQAGQTVARLASLAAGGQILLTRAAFDLARQGAAGSSDGLGRTAARSQLSWLDHGGYAIQGVEEPLNICEVGLVGKAPLTAPGESAAVRRLAAEETILGWRPAPDLTLPQRPHWVVERKLGEGGFGEVWLAAHSKTGERRVFKFCYEARSLRALQREITLFRLLKEELGERDDITRVLDWNFEEPPYFIELEYTSGGSLIDWAEGQGGLERLPLETRLEILAQVAEALAAAHSVGVLHKDVKPGNVLITTDRDDQPQAQVTDFGIGLVTDRERLAKAGITTPGLTVMMEDSDSAAAGTRLYMAPELVEGKAATVQADVYALGVMLYQLVVGDFSRALAPGWRRDVDDEVLCDDIAAAVDGAPERRLGDARRLAERLRSLEARRAAREAEKREHEDAERAMAALARSRRRRKVVALAIAVLAVFAATMAFQARRIAHEAESARQVSEFLVDLFEVSDPYATTGPARGEEVTAREILDRGAERIDRELRGQPEIQARLMSTVGVVYLALGLYDAAGPLLEKALELRRQLYGDEHVEMAESLHDLGRLRRAQGDLEAAEGLYREALTMRRRLLGDVHLEVAESLDSLAALVRLRFDLPAAEPLYREALAIRRRLLGGDHTAVAVSSRALGRLLKERGDLRGAEPLLRQALEAHRRLLGGEHPTVATSMRELALLLGLKGDYETAEARFREALAMQRRLLGDDHSEITSSSWYLADMLTRKGDYERAEAIFRETLADTRRILGDQNSWVAIAQQSVARVLMMRGDLEGAEALCREALVLLRNLQIGDRFETVAVMRLLATVLESKEDLEGSEPLARQALAMARRLGTEGNVGESSLTLARVLMHRGDFDAAEALARQALQIGRRVFHPESSYIAKSLTHLAEVTQLRGDLPGAETLAREALEICRGSLPPGDWQTAHAESVLGAVLTGLGSYAEAEPLMLAAGTALEDRLSHRSSYTRDALERTARLYEASGKADRAAEVRARLQAGRNVK